MFNRSRLGLRLAKQSLVIFRHHFRLLIYPIIGRGCFLLVLSSFSVWLWYLHTKNISINQLPDASIVKFYLILLSALFICNLITIFMSAAFAVTIAEYHTGLNPSIKEGLRAGKKRWLTLFSWIIFRLTFVTACLLAGKVLNERRFVKKLTHDLPWSMAIYFIMPTIMYHPGHVFNAIEESSRLMVEYAGKKATINYSLVLPIILLRLLAFLPLLIAAHYQAWHIVTIISIFSFSLFTVVSIINTSVQNVLHSALYQYVKTNRIPEGFIEGDLKQAIIQKN